MHYTETTGSGGKESTSRTTRTGRASAFDFSSLVNLFKEGDPPGQIAKELRELQIEFLELSLTCERAWSQGDSPLRAAHEDAVNFSYTLTRLIECFTDISGKRGGES